MKKSGIVLLSLLLIVLLAGCAAGGNSFKKVADEQGETAGFLLGLWHGFITPFAFIISLFKDSVGVYELHNNGNWYNFGFVLGLSAIFGGGTKSTCRKRKK